MTIHPKNTILFLSAVALICLGVFVFLLNRNMDTNTKPEEIRKLEYVTTKNDTDTLETEVNSTELDSLDSELNQIEQELSNF